jgi:polyisoprenoid-binding protein YceI
VYSIVVDAKELSMSIVADRSASVIPTGTWTIDPVWSALEFEVKKLGLAVIKGRALSFEGTVTGGDDATIEGSADVSGLTMFEETRDAHLQSPDFFDAERHPTIAFRSTSVDQRGEELVVHGELTIKGKTKPVELRGAFTGTGVDPMGSERIVLELSGTIDRTDFGVDWNAPLPGGGLLLPNEVTLTASFAAVKAA